MSLPGFRSLQFATTRIETWVEGGGEPGVIVAAAVGVVDLGELPKLVTQGLQIVALVEPQPCVVKSP